MSTAVVGLLVFLVSFNAHALGVGGIKLNSTLDQPLDANIELLGVSTEEVSEIEIKLASNAIYERMGIERTSLINQLEFSILEQDDGKYVIHIATDKSVTEPFLNFLIEVNWRNGRLLREFTVLLDPPVLTEEKPAPVATPETELPPSFTVTTESAVESEDTLFPMLESPELVGQSESEESLENRLSAIEEEQSRSTRSAAPSPPPVADVSTSFDANSSMARTVQSGEYLYKIANEMRPQNITVEQMMLALQRENPTAFFGDTISQLKAGAVLRINDSAVLNEISVSEAMAEVARQNQEWLAYKRERQARNAVAADSANTTPFGSDPAPDQVAVADTQQNLLELVSPINEQSQSETSNATQEAATDSKLNELNVELTVASEAVEAGKRENEDLQQRVSALQNQMTAMQNLIQLKDDELQAINKGDATEESGEQLVPSLEVDINKETDVSATTPAGEEIEQAPVDDPLRKLLDDPITLATIAGAGLLVVLLGWVIVRRRGKAGDEELEFMEAEAAAEESFFKDSDAQTREETQVIKYNEALSEKELTEPESEISLEPMTDISFDSNENELLESSEALLDPLAEADVYLTYEKYDKAENLLVKSIDAEPGRQELKLKLMEVYVLAGNMDGFNNMADMLFAAIGGDEHNPIWQQAESLAHDIGSRSPLFHAADQENISTDFLEDDDSLFKDTTVVENETFQHTEIDLPEETQINAESFETPKTETFSSPDDFVLPESEAAQPSVVETSRDELDNINIDFDAFVDERPTIVEESSDQTSMLDDNWQDASLEPQTSEVKIPEDDTLFATESLKSEVSDETDYVSETPVESLQEPIVAEDVTTLINDDIISDDHLKQLSSEFTEDKLVDKTDFSEVEETQVTVDDVFGSDSSQQKTAASGANTDSDFSETSLFLLSDEVGTKLDLAKAYMEMGDHEGARDLLTEVMGEGNSQQKSEAKELLESA